MNINDTSEWLEEANSSAILSKLREAGVNEYWLVSINKLKKAYMNRKADYNKFRQLDDRLHTGGGHRTAFLDEDLMETLAGLHSPSAEPP